MGYPKNPDSIVLKNKYYPYGLTELDIWKYYQRNKLQLLEQTKNRNLMIFIVLENTELVVRKYYRNEPINKDNYDNIIYGRSISIHSLMNEIEDISIIDIDGNDFDKVKKATKDVFIALETKNTFIEKVSIRYTGKTGFHLFCKMKKKNNVSVNRIILTKFLSGVKDLQEYTVKNKRTGNIPNIDLFSNKISGGFITLRSLSIEGLRCKEVSLKDIKNLNPIHFRI